MHPHASPGSPGNIRTRYVLPLAIVALLAALFGGGLTQGAHAQSPGGSLLNWEHAVQSTASVGWVTGPGTPPGGFGGSLSFSTGTGTPAQGGKAWAWDSSYAGMKLSDITALSYSTYSALTNTDPNILDPAIDLEINPEPNNPAGVHYTTLVFEPVYYHFSGNTAQPIKHGEWQTWDTFHGAWWTTRTVGSYQGGGTTYFNLADFQAAYPDAVILGAGTPASGLEIVVGQNSYGPPWQGWSGNVANLSISTSTGGTSIYYANAMNCTTTCTVASTANESAADGSPAHPFANLQTAINAIGWLYPDGGGIVDVGPGTYHGPFTITTPITLLGAGAGVNAGTYPGPYTIIDPASSGFDVYTNGGGPVTISGFRIQHNGAGINLLPGGPACSNSCSLSDVSITDNRFFENALGIQVNNEVTEANIQDNVFYWDRNTDYPDSGYGILINGRLANSGIDHNTFTGESSSAIQFTASSGGDRGNINVVISHNTSNGNGHFAVLNNYSYDGETHQSLPIDYCGDDSDDELICSNTVLQTLGDAIIISKDTSNFDIVGNTISRGTGSAITQIGDGSNNVDIYNNLLSVNIYGLNLKVGSGYGIDVEGNQFVSNRTAGVNVSGGYDTDGLNIEANAFQSNKAGLVNRTGDQFNATCNWWNATSGPRVATNPGGAGDTVVGLDRDSYQPWLVSKDLESNCDREAPTVTVSLAGQTYTVSPGTTVNLSIPASGLIRYMITFTCIDEPGGSGIASCKSTAPYVYIYRGSVRHGTFTVTGLDRAGNSTSITINWTASSAHV